MPAGDLDEVVIGRLRAFLMDPGAIQDTLHDGEHDAATIAKRLHAAKAVAGEIDTQVNGGLRQTILQLVLRVEVHVARVDVHVSRRALRLLGETGHDAGSEGDPVILSSPVARARVGKDVRLVIGPAQDHLPGRRDAALIKLIVKAHAARHALETSSGRSIEKLADGQGYARDYFAVLLRLSYLAPDITSAILEGRQPVTLTRQKPARCRIPSEWDGQRSALSFC